MRQIDLLPWDFVINVIFSEDFSFFPAASYMSFQQCRFNFGSEPFKHPPNRPFNNFNQIAVLKAQDKVNELITK